MLSLGSWISLPSTLSSVLTDVDGRGTDLGLFLAAADLLVLRDGAALVLVLPPEHSWPSEGDRQEALRRGDRPSLPRLQLMPRANCLNWELPVSYGLPGRIIWWEPVNRPIYAEPPGSEGAVAEQINALLGDADAPDRWHYRCLQLLTTGCNWPITRSAPTPRPPAAGVAMSRWSPRLRASTGCRPAGTPPMARPSGRGDMPHLGLAPDLPRHHAARRPDPFPETRCCPTEMEISLPASQSYALLQAMAIQKASFFSTLLQHWCALTGEPLDPGAGLQVTVSPLTPLILPRPQVKAWIEL